MSDTNLAGEVGDNGNCDRVQVERAPLRDDTIHSSRRRRGRVTFVARFGRVAPAMRAVGVEVYSSSSRSS
jgi:hypothetical protein